MPQRVAKFIVFPGFIGTCDFCKRGRRRQKTSAHVPTCRRVWFYQGDVYGAIAQPEKPPTYDLKHAGTLPNLGRIRWKSKSDAAGAIEAWDRLLKYSPDYENKEMAEKLIADAKAHTGKKKPQSE